MAKPTAGSACWWFAFTIWACSAYGGGCKTSLFSAVPDVDIEQPSALAALLQFGFENGVCLAVEAPAIESLKKPVRIHLSHPTVAYVVEKLLKDARYQLSESDGVILIRNVGTMGQTTQMDTVVPEYKIADMSVVMANFALVMRLHRLAAPTPLRGLGASILGDHPNNRVGPINEHGRTARELLTRIVGQSPGGAWVAGQCLGSVLQRPCWSVIEYSDERESVVGRIGHLVQELAAELAPRATTRQEPLRSH